MPRRVAMVEAVHKALPQLGHKPSAVNISTGRPISMPSALSTPLPTPAFGSLEAQQKASPHSKIQLPEGMTEEQFHRAAEIVAATASVMQPALSNSGTPAVHAAGAPLRRQASHVSHVREISRGAEAAAESHGGHDAQNWSRMKSFSVLMLCKVLYAVIAGTLQYISV